VSLASKFAKGTKQNCKKKKINDVKVMSFLIFLNWLHKLLLFFFTGAMYFEGEKGGRGGEGDISHSNEG